MRLVITSLLIAALIVLAALAFGMWLGPEPT